MRWRAALVAALIGLGLVAPASDAGAHALLKSSEPADGTQLTAAPSQIVLTFTEIPDPSLSSVHVFDAAGKEVAPGKAHAVPGHPNELALAVSGLPKGVYTVAWRTVSRVDGHTTGGAFAFGVGVSPAGATLPKTASVKTPSPSVLSVIGRWLFYSGLFLLLGVAATALWIFGAGVRAPPRRLLAVGWIGAFVGLLALVEAQRADAGVGFSDLFGSSLGHALFARAVPLVAVLGGLLLSRNRKRAGLVIVFMGAALTVGAHVYEGHAAAGSWRFGKILLQSGHVIVGGLWVGGLVALLGIRSMETSERQRAVSRFSALALWLVVLLGLSGVGRAINEIDSWHGLFSTSYGQIVIAKSALLLALIALGAVNRYRNVPRAGEAPAGLRRFVSSELVLAVAVLALTGILSGLAPARSVRAAAAPVTSVVASGSDFGTTVRLRLTASPGTAGSNRFELKVSDFDTGAPVNAEVSLRFTYLGPLDVEASQLSLARASDGVYRGTGTNLSIGGVWSVTAVIQRGEGSVEVPLTVATRVNQQVSISAAPGQPTLYTVALSEGRSVQFYVDPGTAGPNEVHATFFDRGGEFKGLSGYSVLATPPGGQPGGLDYRQLAEGHIVSDAQLTTGKWRFDVWAQTNKGELLWSYFEPTIG